jgi:hypothetical protein
MSISAQGKVTLVTPSRPLLTLSLLNFARFGNVKVDGKNVQVLPTIIADL